MQQLLEHPVLLWFGIAILFALVELAVPTFGFLFAALAAVIAAGAAGLELRWELQAVIFTVALLLSLFLLRPRLLKKLGAPGVPSRTDALLGRKGRVTVAIDAVAGHGRVEVDGADWAATSENPIAAGTEIHVDGSDGIVLQVRKA